MHMLWENTEHVSHIEVTPPASQCATQPSGLIGGNLIVWCVSGTKQKVANQPGATSKLLSICHWLCERENVTRELLDLTLPHQTLRKPWEKNCLLKAETTTWAPPLASICQMQTKMPPLCLLRNFTGILHKLQDENGALPESWNLDLTPIRTQTCEDLTRQTTEESATQVMFWSLIIYQWRLLPWMRFHAKLGRSLSPGLFQLAQLDVPSPVKNGRKKPSITKLTWDKESTGGQGKREASGGSKSGREIRLQFLWKGETGWCTWRHDLGPAPFYSLKALPPGKEETGRSSNKHERNSKITKKKKGEFYLRG